MMFPAQPPGMICFRYILGSSSCALVLSRCILSAAFTDSSSSARPWRHRSMESPAMMMNRRRLECTANPGALAWMNAPDCSWIRSRFEPFFPMMHPEIVFGTRNLS